MIDWVCYFFCVNTQKQTNQEAEAAFERGRKSFENGDYDQAIKDYTEAVRLDPNYVAAYSGRGICYQKKEKFDKAIKDFS